MDPCVELHSTKNLAQYQLDLEHNLKFLNGYLTGKLCPDDPDPQSGLKYNNFSGLIIKKICFAINTIIDLSTTNNLIGPLGLKNLELLVTIFGVNHNRSKEKMTNIYLRSWIWLAE